MKRSKGGAEEERRGREPRSSVLRPVPLEGLAGDASHGALLASAQRNSPHVPRRSPGGEFNTIPSFQIFGLELTPEDMKAIDGLNRNFILFKFQL